MLTSRILKKITFGSKMTRMRLGRFFADLPDHEVLTMPSLSPTMETGKIAQWNFEVGDEVGPGDVIADIETDKSNVGYEVQEDGVLAKILIEPGVEAKLGEPIAIVVLDEDDVPAFANYDPSKKPKKKKSVKKTTQSTSTAQTTQSTSTAQTTQSTSTAQTTTTKAKKKTTKRTGERAYISPLAKNMLIDQGVDLSLAGRIDGSGPRGRIISKDVKGLDASSLQDPVEATIAPAKSTATVVEPPAGVEYEDIPLSGMRKVIAQRLTESKQSIPHYYETIGIKMDNLLATTINQSSSVKISVNDMIIKAASLTCEDIPEVNSQWMGDFIRKFEDVDVSFAVAVDEGLITPIVKYANEKRLSEIAEDTQELIQKARDNKLSPDEYQGGTFTISNLGMFGIQQFTSIINMPQSCILAVGATEKKPIFNSEAENNIEWVNEMLVTLSSDHRVVDGVVSAQWLNRFKHYMENPMNMLI